VNKATLLAATAAIAFIATPALAKDQVQSRPHAHMKSSHAHAKSKMRHHNAHHARAMHSGDRFARRDERGNWNRDHWHHRSGFWPTDTAAGIAGGAIGTAGAIASGAVNTAGAIATAPFRGGYDNSYYGEYRRPYGDVAYRNDYRYDHTYASMDEGFGTYNYNGTAIPGSPSFDARNGFTCRPGTITKLNGQPTICQ
jgi:hypothetical protein